MDKLENAPVTSPLSASSHPRQQHHQFRSQQRNDKEGYTEQNNYIFGTLNLLVKFTKVETVDLVLNNILGLQIWEFLYFN